jgi:hypothetical protein
MASRLPSDLDEVAALVAIGGGPTWPQIRRLHKTRLGKLDKRRRSKTRQAIEARDRARCSVLKQLEARSA